jgi:TatD DNase family protein
MLIDSHCHLDAHYFPEGADAVLERGRIAGVGHFVVIGVGEGIEAAEAAVELAHRRVEVSATVGMHPHDAAHLTDALYLDLRRLGADPAVVALGEVGLDHHYMRSAAAVQEEVFRRMVALGRELGKPIVVHTRSAPRETLRILEEEGAREVGGIIHCFSEDRDFARRALDLDFDISLSGMVTFPKAAAIQEVARFTPSGRLLVETDSPYLAPVPRRGKRNEPANVVYTARFVAELRGERFEDFAANTVRATVQRLRLPVSSEGVSHQNTH